MQYEDKLAIATPEGVSLEVALAGAGSRAGAATIDALIQFSIVFVLALVFGGLASDIEFGASTGGGPDTETALFALAILNVLLFVVLFFYSVLFETLWAGVTPGKRAFRLRVVQISGARIGFRASMTRNLLRIVDFLPTFYLVGIIAVVVNERNQRLGDMVAGTVVVHDRPAGAGTWSTPSLPLQGSDRSPGVLEATQTWDMNAITGDDLAAVRAFLQRRHTIPLEVREKLAGELDSKLRPKVAGAQDWSGYPETFLELLAAAKSARS